MSTSELQVTGEELRWKERRVPLAEVTGFVERFSPWTGRAWLVVLGPGWEIPLDAGYGPVRRALREALPDRPFDADWADGRFPPAPLGLPSGLVFAGAALVVLSLSMAVVLRLGLGPGVGVILAGLWPLGRLRVAVAVRREGLRVGPPWAPVIPWHEVGGVCVQRAGRSARVWLRGSRVAGRARVPAVLLPALRARLRRLGGMELEESVPTLDDRYAAALGPVTGIPWGLLVATAVGLVVLPNHAWTVLTAGVLASLGTAMLAAAVEARATGWGAGAVLYGTAMYALVLVAVALGSSGLFEATP